MNEHEAIEAEVVTGPMEQRADGAQASAEPIDGERTANKPQRVKRVVRNWAAMRKAWVAGEPVCDIAALHGMTPANLYCKASRANWPKRKDTTLPELPVAKQRELVTPAVKQAVEPFVHEQVTSMAPMISAEIKRELADWFRGVVGTSRAIKEHIDYSLNRQQGKVEVEEIKSLALSLASIDTTVRRTFGLDSPDGRNLGVLASCRASVECPFEPAVQAVAQAATSLEAGQVGAGGNGS